MVIALGFGASQGTPHRGKDADKVTELSGEVQEYQNRELPVALLTRELAAQYDGVRQVTLTRGSRTDAESGESREVIVAILNCAKPPKEAERLRIQNWLKVRLGVEEVEVLIDTKK